MHHKSKVSKSHSPKFSFTRFANRLRQSLQIMVFESIRQIKNNVYHFIKISCCCIEGIKVDYSKDNNYDCYDYFCDYWEMIFITYG